MSSLVSDLLDTSARRMLQALANDETNPVTLAVLADQRLRATPHQLRNAFGACADLHPVYRRLVKLTLDELQVIWKILHQGVRYEECGPAVSEEGASAHDDP